VGLILDGGPSPVGIESTVVSLAGTPTLLRPGIIPPPEIEEVTGPLARPTPGAGEEARPSPGMMDRHYAPRAAVRLYSAEQRATAASAARAAAAERRTVGALLLGPLDAPVDHPYPMPDDPAAYARLLYATLHAMDAAGCDLVLVEAVPDTPEWEGVRDRLQRAADPV
ncbi:MAG: Sua5 family C-terminal domain-containing protein, partial [Gemmatimonadota bacterium]